MAQSMCHFLCHSGYDAIATSDVHEALLILRTQPIDLLTLAFGSRHISPPDSLRNVLPEEFYLPDSPMPAMNGEEFLSLIKADDQLRRIPVVLVTGHEKKTCARLLERFDLSIERDVDGYVSKGDKGMLEKLLETIASVTQKSCKKTKAG